MTEKDSETKPWHHLREATEKSNYIVQNYIVQNKKFIPKQW